MSTWENNTIVFVTLLRRGELLAWTARRTSPVQFPHDDPYRLQTAAHAGSTPMPGSLAPVALAPKQQRNQPGSPEVIPPLQVLVCSMIYEETGRRGGGKVQINRTFDEPRVGLRTDSDSGGDDGGPTQYDDVSLTKQRKLWCPVPRQPHLHVKHQLPPTCRRNALASRRSCASAQTPFPFSPALSLLGAASHALPGSVYLTTARNPWNRRVRAQVYPSARAAVGGAAFLRGSLCVGR